MSFFLKPFFIVPVVNVHKVSDVPIRLQPLQNGLKTGAF